MGLGFNPRPIAFEIRGYTKFSTRNDLEGNSAGTLSATPAQESGSIFYSTVERCRGRGLGSYCYLSEVLSALHADQFGRPKTGRAKRSAKSRRPARAVGCL